MVAVKDVVPQGQLSGFFRRSWKSGSRCEVSGFKVLSAEAG